MISLSAVQLRWYTWSRIKIVWLHLFLYAIANIQPKVIDHTFVIGNNLLLFFCVSCSAANELIIFFSVVWQFKCMPFFVCPFNNRRRWCCAQISIKMQSFLDQMPTTADSISFSTRGWDMNMHPFDCRIWKKEKKSWEREKERVGERQTHWSGVASSRCREYTENTYLKLNLFKIIVTTRAYLVVHMLKHKVLS